MYTQLQMRGSARPPVSLATLHKMRASGDKIACLTCYDASFAVLVDEADADVVLVGDSLGMVIQGHQTTVPVTMDDIVYHCRAVSRGLQRPLLMADLPFASFPSKNEALSNSVRLMQEGGAAMVKLETGAGQIEIVEFLANHDIAVCAHLGLKPQSVHKTGGFRVQGRESDVAERMVADAKALEAAGADMMFDCRFLANPHWEPALRPLDGRDAAVQNYVASDPRFAEFFQRVRDLALFTLPAHLEEGKAHLAIGFGCTGGQHRSVTMAEKMADALAKAGWQVSIRHRELERREKAPAPADEGLSEASRAARAQGQTAVRGGAN